MLGAVLLFVAGCNLGDDPQVATPDDNCDRCGVCDADPTNDCVADCSAESFGGSGDVNVFFSSEDGWSQSQVTFDSAPSFSDFIVASTNVANFVEGQDMPLEIVDDPELIERFQSEVWGNKIVTLRLASPGYRTAFHSTVPNITIQRASLQVISHTGFAYGGNGNVFTYLVEDDSWEESEVTFNNSPSWVNEELGFWFIWHDGSFADKPGINGYRTLYRTREFTNPDQRPKLVLYYLPD